VGQEGLKWRCDEMKRTRSSLVMLLFSTLKNVVFLCAIVMCFSDPAGPDPSQGVGRALHTLAAQPSGIVLAVTSPCLQCA
jgi:hypothetical protein